MFSPPPDPAANPSKHHTPLSAVKALAKTGLHRAGLEPLLFRYHEWRMARRPEVAPVPPTDDAGLPLPSAYLMTLVAGEPDWRRFLEGGRDQARTIADLVTRHGGAFHEAERLLDLGCGCGRIIRHMPGHSKAALYGVDYNPRLVRWCARNLPGTFAQNQVTPPLEFPDAHFDAVCLLSVFTHLRLDTQNQWLAELARVVRPGGTVVVTFHDETHPGLDLVGLTEEALLEKQFHIHNDRAEGSNFISTFQTQDFMQSQCKEHFTVCEIVPSRETPLIQAAAVL
ncbi:MAG: class I SAM-dependent methyltransferase, partial [Pseudomonadota bacterium]